MHVHIAVIPGFLLALTLTLAASGGRPAGAQVSAADEICPTADPCLIQKKIEVASGALLDYGSRTVRIMRRGKLVLEPRGRMTLACGSLLIDEGGSLEAPGGLSDAAGTIDLSVEANLTVAGEIDVSGHNGGTLSLTAGSVNVSGTITAAGKGGGAVGGILTIDATENVLVSGKLLAGGGNDGNGGSVEITSGGGVEIGKTAVLRVDGSGFGSGGFISVDSRAPLTYKGTTSAVGGIDFEGGGDGGVLDVTVADDCQIEADITVASGVLLSTGGLVTISCEGTATVTGDIDAGGNGSESAGGEIRIEGRNGLTISSKVLASGGSNGDGGVIEITSDATVLLAAKGIVRVDGFGFGFAGEIRAGAGKSLIIEGTISADGGTNLLEGGGFGGIIDLDTPENCTISGSVTALSGNPAAVGGTVNLETGGEFNVGGKIDVSGRGEASSGGELLIDVGSALISGQLLAETGTDGDGGLLVVESSGTIELTSTGRMNADGKGSGAGGQAFLQACVTTTAARSVVTTLGHQGTISVTGINRSDLAGTFSTDRQSGSIEVVYRDFDPVIRPSSVFEPLATIQRDLNLSGCEGLRPTPTSTPTAVTTNTPATTSTPTPTASRSPTAVPPLVCVGDCNGNGMVWVEELVKGVNIALGGVPLDDCSAFDSDGNKRVTVEELVRAVNAALSGCPPP